jgi:hypothetical protein
MGGEHSELKKRLRGGLGVLAGMFIGQCIYTWHAFPDQGFKAFQWDRFLFAAFGAISVIIGVWLVGQRKEITTLGVGEAKAKKLR